MKKEKENILIEVNGLKKYFPIKKGIFQQTVGQIKAVDNINFKIKFGETLGLVGESGCGKSTAGQSILRLIEPTEGNIKYNINKSLQLDQKFSKIDPSSGIFIFKQSINTIKFAGGGPIRKSQKRGKNGSANLNPL